MLENPNDLMELIKKAENGEAEAQYRLGYMYESGMYNLVTKEVSETEAVKWWTKAAEQGHIDAQFTLGWIYYRGEMVKQDKDKGLYFWNKAAKQGHLSAQHYLDVASVNDSIKD